MSLSSQTSSRRSSTNSVTRSSTSSLKGKTTGRKSLEPKKNYDDLKGFSLKDLREKKQAAIKALNFDEAARITRYMAGNNVDETATFAESLKNELCQNVDYLLRTYDLFEKEANKKYFEEESKIRAQKKVVFDRLVKDFEDKVHAYEIDRKIDLTLENQRAVGQQQALEAKARNHAKNDNFEEAKQTLQEANEVGNIERQRRCLVVNDKYDKLIENAEIQLMNDIQSLQARVETEINNALGRYNNAIAQQQKITAAQIVQAPQKLLTKRMSSETKKETTEMKSNEKKRQDNSKFKQTAKDTLQKLENYLISKLQDEDRMFVFAARGNT